MNYKIACCFDSAYVIPACVSFESLLEHAQSADAHYEINVIGSDLTVQDRQRMERVVGKFHQATLRFPDTTRADAFVSEMRTSGNWNGAYKADLFYKLLIPELLPDADIVLALDVDTIYEKDIACVFRELSENDSYYVVGSPDIAYAAWRGSGLFPNRRKMQSKYFKFWTQEERSHLSINAGLMLFNCKRLRADGIVTRWIDYARSNMARLVLPEQDVIGQVCWPHVKVLPWSYMAYAPHYETYEKMSSAERASNGTWEETFASPLQIHYTTSRKPWLDYTVPAADRWLLAASRAGVPLRRPKSAERRCFGVYLEKYLREKFDPRSRVTAFQTESSKPVYKVTRGDGSESFVKLTSQEKANRLKEIVGGLNLSFIPGVAQILEWGTESAFVFHPWCDGVHVAPENMNERQMSSLLESYRHMQHALSPLTPTLQHPDEESAFNSICTYARQHPIVARLLAPLLSLTKGDRSGDHSLEIATHGDFHYENITFKGDQLASILDFETIVSASPVRDLVYLFIRRWYKARLTREQKSNLDRRFEQAVRAMGYPTAEWRAAINSWRIEWAARRLKAHPKSHFAALIVARRDRVLRHMLSLVPEPIDFVFLWCDLSDPKFAAKRLSEMKRVGLVVKEGDNGTCRYVSHDELRYAMRSVDRFLPWIRHVHLVVDDDISLPQWLNVENKRLQIHRWGEIMPSSLLPCFNSSTFEFFLQDIPGLSERFLYANDDMMIARPLTRDFFFDKWGKTILRYTNSRIDMSAPTIEDGYKHRVRESFRFIKANCGLANGYEKAYGCLCHHCIDGLIRSDLAAFRTRFSERWQAHVAHPFRSRDQLQREALAGFEFFQGHAVYRNTKQCWLTALFGGSHRDSWHCIPTRQQLVADFKRIKPSLICVNDSPEVKAEDRARADAFLQSLFPVKSTFEI